MYTPQPNAETDLPTLHAFIRGNPLCALVTETAEGMVATHIPVVLHESERTPGILRGHVARANPQWKSFLPTREALAIFTGPQHYISPSWYPGKQVHGKEVPTWNYVAVHAYGTLRAIEDPAWLFEHLQTLTNIHEVISEVPWNITDAPPEYIANMTRAIVGLELQITRFEARYKLSQNRNDDDATAVMQALDRQQTTTASTMSNLIATRRPR